MRLGKWIVFGGVLWILGSPVWADNDANTIYNPIANNAESVTVAGSAVGLTAANYIPATGTRAQRAFITVETAQIRFWYDGTTPTSTTGHIADAGSTIVLNSQNAIANFRAIRTTSTSASLQVTYERNP